MEGDGTIRLENKDYQVGKGAGVYLGPSETASIEAKSGSTVKLFHLTVPNKLPTHPSSFECGGSAPPAQS